MKKNILIIILFLVCVFLCVICLVLDKKNTELEKHSNNAKECVKEDVNLLSDGSFYSLNFYNPNVTNNTTSIFLGNYEIDDMNYRLAVQFIDEEYIEDDVNKIRSNYFVNVNYKDYAIPFNIMEVSLVGNLLYINGFDDDYYEACVFDIVGGEIVKYIQDGNIYNQKILLGDNWEKYRLFSVCDDEDLIIKAFNENNINDVTNYKTITGVHCGQED